MLEPGAKKPARPRPYYLLQRTGFVLSAEGQHLAVARPDFEQPDNVPLMLFLSKRKAEALCAELERRDRLEFSPFLFMYEGELDSITDFTDYAWLARLRELGVEPPTEEQYPCRFGGIDWHAWWKAKGGELSDEQRLGIWDICNIALYTVTQVKED